MELGTLIGHLAHDGDAASTLAALDDLALLVAVQDMGAHHDETPGAYVAAAARRFADRATPDEWVGLMAILARADDPASAALGQMVRWALARDAAALAGTVAPGCGCGGHADHPSG